MKKLLIYTAISLFLALSSVSYLYKNERTERKRTESNQNALLTGIKHWKTKDSLNAVTITQLELSKKEMKKYEADLVERLKDKDIKIKRLESVTSLKTESKIEFKTITKDSLVYLPGKDSIVAIKCMEYKDAWVDFVGCQNDIKLVVKDSLDIIGHRVPKNIWFIKYGIKSVDIDIISYNPYTDIKYAKQIKLQRKK